ncbi:MAG: MotA/TolQ/ExbB proton channel family protein [Marinobacterium sp.]|jgi:biopolymer transport protein ExbB
MDILVKGGVITWILVAYSVVGFSIVISAYLRLLKGRGAYSDPLVPDGSTGEYKEIFQRLTAAQQSGLDQESLRVLALRLITTHIRYFETGLKTLSVLANTAPLMGLLGTIIGMISAFRVIESEGAGVNAQMLAGGIWEAMLTTGVGLAVALPLLFFLHALESLIEKHHWQLYVAVSEVIHEPVESQGI